MSKPPGISMGCYSDGTLRMGVTRSSDTEDKIWDAVELAIDHSWTVKQFRREAASAWTQVLREKVDAAEKEWRRND